MSTNFIAKKILKLKCSLHMKDGTFDVDSEVHYLSKSCVRI